jgi:hypothetical protein
MSSDPSRLHGRRRRATHGRGGVGPGDATMEVMRGSRHRDDVVGSRAESTSRGREAADLEGGGIGGKHGGATGLDEGDYGPVVASLQRQRLVRHTFPYSDPTQRALPPSVPLRIMDADEPPEPAMFLPDQLLHLSHASLRSSLARS